MNNKISFQLWRQGMRNRQGFKVIFCGAFAVGLFASMAMGLAAIAKEKDQITYWQPSQIPSYLQYQFIALGDRHQKPGKERLTLAGNLIAGTNSQSAEVIMEKGGKIRIATSSKSVRFDGNNGSANISNDDRELLESLVDDLPETLLDSSASGSDLQLIGSRLADSKGGFYDLYDALIFSKIKKPIIARRYCFDSITKMLIWVQYNHGPNTPVITTRFNNWVKVDGQAVPSAISRMQDGKQVFTFEIQNVQIAGKQEDDLFKP
jgi:hypothetical protein